ncbi:MAG: hypothetical protein GXX86_12940 [Propionibacterium sp.]|nr:hypothetical protein [Propionibacterium sp.]
MSDFTVELGALRTDATTFDDLADFFVGMVDTIQQWQSNIPDWGLMSDAKPGFDTATSGIATFADTGRTTMQDIANNLRNVADVYEAEEEAGVHASTGIY